jgi:hypothetical protein
MRNPWSDYPDIRLLTRKVYQVEGQCRYCGEPCERTVSVAGDPQYWHEECEKKIKVLSSVDYEIHTVTQAEINNYLYN